MTSPFLEPAVQRLAAAAPTPLFEEPEDPLSDRDRDLDALCEQWVSWCRSRRLYGPSPRLGSILGQLSGKSSRSMTPGGPDAIASAELSAFHIAYTCQPDALDKHVFDLYYVHRVKPIKSAAAALGISRKHFYDVLGEFRRRVASAADALVVDNADTLERMRKVAEERNSRGQG